MRAKNEQNITEEWFKVRDAFEGITGKKPGDLNGVLYLIGIQELGKGIREFSKEEKQDLIHIATCEILSYSGYYEFSHIDEEGWPHYELKTPLPHLPPKEQVTLLKSHIIEYFYEKGLIE